MELKVNSAEWNGLSEQERGRVQEIVGGFFKDSTIVPDEATPASGASAQFLGGFCKIACDIAQTAASAACAALPNPIAIAACVALAKAAGDECRNRC